MTPTSTESGAHRPRRILVLSPWGLDGIYSGPSILLSRLYGQVVRMEPGIQVDVASTRRLSAQAPPWARAVVYLFDRGPKDSFGRLGQVIWLLRATMFVLRKARHYDILHIHGAFANNLFVAFAAVSRSLGYIVFPVLEHGDLPRARRSPISSLRRFCVSRAAGAASLSNGISEDLRRHAMPEASITLVGNPVDTDEFFPARAGEPGVLTVGFVGRVCRRKNAILVLEAASRAYSNGVNLECMFVGPYESAEFEEDFLKHARALSIRDRITVTGAVHDVSQYLNEKIDIFVLPSTSEGLPGALCEALASGVPAVVTDVGAMGDAIRASGAGIVVEANVESVAAAIQVLADPARRSAFSDAARAYAIQNFSLDVVAGRLLRILDSASHQTVKRAR